MRNGRLAIIVGFFALGSGLAVPSSGRTQPVSAPSGSALAPLAPAPQEGTEVLARGPIHEAFAEPVENRPGPGRLVPKQPPAPIEELPPDQKPAGDNVQWIPGYWAWDDDRNDFIWISGIWRNDPPGRQWVPGHWDPAAGGWQWSPGFWGVGGQQQLEFLPPPPAPLPAANSVPAPDNNSALVPGTWVYQQTRYLWRPGYWVSYRPGWVWVPAHYVWTPAGYVFVDGYWDFDLNQRGLLFAPVYVTPAYWTRPNWAYRPAYVIGTDFLLSALFIRPGYNHYYFGDYFEPVHRRNGFVAWIDFPRDRLVFDPLLNYYRWQHRENRRWERDLRSLYAARYSGTAPRPPRTLVQQNVLLRNITADRKVSPANLNVITPLTPLVTVNRTVVKLQPVSPQQRVATQQSIQRLHELGRERARLETQIVGKSSAHSPRVVTINLPKPAAPAHVSVQPQAPPPPIVIGRPQIRTEATQPIGTPSRPESKPLKTFPKPDGKGEAKPPAKPEPKSPAGPPKPPHPQPKSPSDTKKPRDAKPGEPGDRKP